MDEFDYVIVGAGSAGCPLAARLSESGQHSVLLLEAGGVDRNIWIHIPLGVGKLLQNTKYVWPFTTEPEHGLLGQRIYWPRGKVLGGSSSINGMVYVRGDPDEYDHWRELGNVGWGYADLLPYFKRMEDYPPGDPTVRGHGGPMHIVNRGAWDPDPLSDAFLGACRGIGIPQNPDYNAGKMEGVSYLQQTGYNGRRWSAAAGYLAPARGRRNLRIQLGALVTRVLFEGRRAIGIEYLQGDTKRVVRTRREIILSAGSVQTPQLLELSGVGDGNRLRALGIEVVHHVPAVGEGLQDHVQVRFSYECTVPNTINDMMRSPIKRMIEGARYVFSRRGLLSTTSSTIHAIARTNPNRNRADVKIQLAHISGKDRYSRSKEMGIDPYPGFSLGVFVLRPESRGSVHARSPNPAEAPMIQANYLSDSQDVETCIAGLKMIRRIAAQPALARFIVAERRPGPDAIGDEQILDYARQTGQTSWHPIGSCRMGSDPESVVDPRLRVRGIEGLRVADCSIMPTMASSNTNAPALMIGEKASALVLEDAQRGL